MLEQNQIELINFEFFVCLYVKVIINLIIEPIYCLIKIIYRLVSYCSVVAGLIVSFNDRLTTHALVVVGTFKNVFVV